MPKMTTVIIVKDETPINSVCLTGDEAQSWISNYDGTTVMPDPEDDFGTEFITVSGCVAIDVTGLSPIPGVGNGWSYVNGEWVAPPEPEEEQA